MKIIFLDIDGVLNSRDYYKSVNMKVKNWSRFDPVNVKLIKELLEEFDAKIVITSSWRFGAKELLMTELKKSNLLKYLHKDWKTPKIYSEKRGEEIRRWLDKHPEVDDYVIYDDAEDMLPEQSAFFIKTNSNTGLTLEDYEKARSILSGNIP